ncbi:sugar ABC transporter permease [Candidatus Cryosericum hinesii]|jgi:putative multiple sugar transport system permease protein|uniref:Xylose transport system permease protein XylH n=1 Tax=Candidatus Cryosericum hinesii TaxID=2290915 RepID=A0A398DGU7_9BACT|nr:sugar ABC transporter permease [Candidatus Cryosericum hinesii]RIE09128.1 sugar ABC transporter permease [Candidatus Cryosericum hinesii]RIE11695.1 sugar ABC transporter permease [Candidatus Cryosericum hinesii]RIE12959.1 sugar ABC transporter permease [Candidatus Cryosericum hinesii]
MSTKRFKTSFMKDVSKTLRQNIRDWGMYIALLTIMAIFTITTKGVFISSRNIGNLIDQTGYIAVLAVGMTLVIVIRDIDLSVGFLAGFLGAVAAISMVSWHLPVYASIPVVLGLGVLAGLLTGFLVAQMKIPAFVATLAGWLGYRGALQLATMSRGTIIIPSDAFNAIGNGYIPDIPGIGILPGVHKLTLILGVVAIALFIISAINNRRKMRAYDSKVLAMHLFIIELVFVSALVGAITWVLAGYRGLSWTGVVVLIVVIFYNFVMSRTVLGRHIYAVGGNPEAAELSGISVKKVTYVVFASMGLLAALSGILFASRFKSATTTAGTLFELDAIAAAFVGGASPSGGVGKVTGSIVGAFVMMSLTSGMNLMGIDISYQYIVKALVLAGAVIFDIAARNRARE